MGGFCSGGFVQGDFVLGGILSRGILSRGFCPGGFVRGDFVLEPYYSPSKYYTGKTGVLFIFLFIQGRTNGAYQCKSDFLISLFIYKPLQRGKVTQEDNCIIVVTLKLLVGVSH